MITYLAKQDSPFRQVGSLPHCAVSSPQSRMKHVASTPILLPSAAYLASSSSAAAIVLKLIPTIASMIPIDTAAFDTPATAILASDNICCDSVSDAIAIDHSTRLTILPTFLILEQVYELRLQCFLEYESPSSNTCISTDTHMRSTTRCWNGAICIPMRHNASDDVGDCFLCH